MITLLSFHLELVVDLKVYTILCWEELTNPSKGISHPSPRPLKDNGTNLNSYCLNQVCTLLTFVPLHISGCMGKGQLCQNSELIKEGDSASCSAVLE
jgi:hypothetical protein